jgi:outer membrane protein OmpA-like peptidoglycan-associated protein
MKPIVLFLFSSFLAVSCSAQNEIRKDSITVSFDYNRSEIPDTENLVAQLDKMDASSLTVIKLVGYTDSTGSLKNNHILAADRIMSVVNVLKSSRLKRVRVETTNANETSGFRIAPDELNRRVDILFYAKENAPKSNPILTFELNKPVNLNVNFKGGTAEFLASSYPNLELLKKIMLEDTTLLLRLQGHVCCDNDLDLSVRRAYAVAGYLNKNGIEHKRMLSEGFSNKMPLVADDTEEHMLMNRRVEAIFYRKE